jgi:hypothetical protein
MRQTLTKYNQTNPQHPYNVHSGVGPAVRLVPLLVLQHAGY